jgi:hypothetical protein
MLSKGFKEKVKPYLKDKILNSLLEDIKATKEVEVINKKTGKVVMKDGKPVTKPVKVLDMIASECEVVADEIASHLL